MRFLFSVVVCSAIFSGTSPAISEPKKLNGSDTLQFQSAVDTWLQGDDLVALRALAELSQQGNPAAQILLARIGNQGNLHSHVTAALPRKERIELLRIPKGLSGKSWLSEAQKTEPLAVALLQSSRIGERAAAVAALAEFGEHTAALLAAESMLLQGQAVDLVEVLQGLDRQLPDEAAVLLQWASAQAASSESHRNVGSARVGPAFLEDGHFQAHELVWLNFGPRHIVDFSNLRDSVLTHHAKVRPWKPLVNFCQEHCSESVASCTTVGASAMWAAGRFALNSPLESVIPNDVYWSSARIKGDMSRVIPDVRRWKDGNNFKELDVCFFGEMESSQSVHGYGR